MRANLSNILKLSTANEGGYSNHPKDPGGPTNHGITQATLSAYKGSKASIAQVKALTLAEANAIYEDNYWRPIRGDDLPSGLDYAVFDFGINSGPSRAIKELQKIVGVAPDGVMGRKTLDAISGQEVGFLIRQYIAARMKFFQGLKTWKTFGRGWQYRTLGTDPLGKYRNKPGVLGDALAMSARQPIRLVALPLDLDLGKAREESLKILAPFGNKMQAGTIASAVLTTVASNATDLLPKWTSAAAMLEPYKDSAKIVGVLFLGITVGCAALTIMSTIQRYREQGSDA